MDYLCQYFEYVAYERYENAVGLFFARYQVGNICGGMIR